MLAGAMKIFPLILILVSPLVYAQNQSCYLKMNEGQSYQITDFQPERKSCVISSDQRAVEQLRVFRSDGIEYAWVVDKYALVSYVVPKSCMTSCDAITSNLKYDELLKISTAKPFPLENDGITKDLKTKNTYLTIDLCPSSKAYDRDFFQYLSKFTDARKEIFPVAIALSGGWLLNHKHELQEIINLQKAKKIQITWVNHTRHHHYAVGIANEHNFLLGSKFDSYAEILDQEQLMLANGLVPSIFLRYPGLVSDQKLVELTRALGLIPLGSRAWIAKTNNFLPGDILLLHGNGNERRGIDLFYQLVRDNKIFEYTWRALTQWGE